MHVINIKIHTLNNTKNTIFVWKHFKEIKVSLHCVRPCCKWLFADHPMINIQPLTRDQHLYSKLSFSAVCYLFGPQLLQKPTSASPLLPLPLIFCPSRGRGLVLSCLSARQFYLSISEPSAGRPWPRIPINPVSAQSPSIRPLSITSDPSSTHLSTAAHVKPRMKG